MPSYGVMKLEGGCEVTRSHNTCLRVDSNSGVQGESFERGRDRIDATLGGHTRTIAVRGGRGVYRLLPIRRSSVEGFILEAGSRWNHYPTRWDERQSHVSAGRIGPCD